MQFLIFINFAAALQGIFLTFLIVLNRNRDKKSVVLAMLMLVLSVSILGGIYGVTGYYKKLPHLVNIADPLFLLYGPLLFIYIYTLTKNRLPGNYLLHGIPFLAYIIAFIPLYLKSPDEKIQFAEYIFLSKQVPVEGLIMQLSRVLYLAVYVLLSIRIVRRYQGEIKNNYSDIENISLHRSKTILYFFLAVLAIAVTTFVSGYFLSYNFNLSNNIIGFFVAILIYSLAYSTWNRRNLAVPGGNNKITDSRNTPGDTGRTKGRSSFVLSEEQFREFAGRLQHAIEKEKVYTENEISLSELSRKLDIQAYQLSELISRLSGESFFDYINRHRIAEIKKRLKDPKYNSFSILGVAMDCGFNSKSSFNTAFRKFTGYTPSEFRNREPVSA